MDPDETVEAAMFAAELVHEAATKYERATLSYLTNRVGRKSMNQFERLSTAELHWMTVCFFQYAERHHDWIEEIFQMTNADLVVTFHSAIQREEGAPDADQDESDNESGGPDDELLCVNWLEWHNRHLGFFYDDLDDIVQAHCSAHAQAFAMISLPRLGRGSMWWGLDKDILAQITQALVKRSPASRRHPRGTCLPPEAHSVSVDRVLDLRCRRSRTPEEWSLSEEEVQTLNG